MPRHRTLHALLAALVAVGVVGIAGVSPARAAVVKAIVFPVDGTVTYTDTFGACRGTGCERTHEGQDLMGKKMLPLVAAVDGVVQRLVFNNTSTGGNSVTIKGGDGWTYHYIHVNNDTPGTDDAKATRAQAFPADIVTGATVRRGQVVAYMGDSGNAESTAPHLHFEIREPAPAGSYTGTAINPYESLQAAVRLGVPSASARWQLRSTASTGPATSALSFGSEVGDRALLCDWNGDGLDEPVLYRGNVWHLRAGVNDATTARKFSYGRSTDIPLCADMDGDPGDEPVVFRGGTWFVRGGFGTADPQLWSVGYGDARDTRPVLGDWDGNGTADLAVVRGGTWHLRSSGGPGGTTVHQISYGGRATDVAVAADWDGDGDDDMGIYRDGTWHPRSTADPSGTARPTFVFGTTGSQPLTGAYAPTTSTNVGVYNPRLASG